MGKYNNEDVAHLLGGTKYLKTNIFLKLTPLFDIGLQFDRSLAL